MTETRKKKIKIELFKEQETYTIYNGSMLDMLQVIELNSIDAIVTDPPYELNFMNKGWDRSGIAFNVETWKQCYQALKPGGYLLAFGGSRTFHRIAVAIEDAGFEIRDTIMWLYGSGFPKSMNISKAIEAKITTGSANKTQFSELKGEKLERGNWGIAKNSKEYGFRDKDYTTETHKKTRLGKLEATTDLANEWQGWGTALKPAYEPVIVARKPFKGSLVDNIIENGVGGINIDECRVETDDIWHRKEKETITALEYQRKNKSMYAQKTEAQMNENGRFPSNIIHDDSFQIDIETQANRYFYSAKASKKDRDEGLNVEYQTITDGRNKPIDNAFNRGETPRKNIHPTVKPCELMQYLVRLVAPKGATILDPFMGSGSTGKAVMFENRERNANYKFIGIDLEEKYCQIANARIDYALNKYKYDLVKEQQQAKQNGQTSIFDFWGG